MVSLIALSLPVIAVIAVLYLIYQLKRNTKVRDIRLKWIEEEDNRFHEYTYDFMYDPSKHNVYGLQFPKESNF